MQNTLNVFDIDETLFHTTAKILVVKDGKIVYNLTNTEFNTYSLKDGEWFDFSEFKSAKKFMESVPIPQLITRAKFHSRDVKSKVVLVTARANFDDKDKFLSVLQLHGLDVKKIRVERAGNIQSDYSVATKKYIIIYNYLNTLMYNKVRLYDDSLENLKVFLSMKRCFPGIEFEAHYVKADGACEVLR